MVDEKLMLLGRERCEIEAFMESLGEPAYRGRQLFQWIHKKRVFDFHAMSNLPLQLREKLSQRCKIEPLETRRCQLDPVDGTRKYLFSLTTDNETIETVLMKHRHGYSLCVSTQVGCRMGCRFCASTLGGKVRNLTAAEIVGQVLTVQQSLDQEQLRISHIVVMGMGEPLENYDATLKFLKIIHDPEGLGIGWRHMTVSTCGLVPEIRRLADEKLPITLAVSLHAPNDFLRRQIMPISVRYPMEQLMDACKYYIEKTGRRISFEYIMLADTNDHEEHARELASLLSGLNCHVNLIPLNPVAERPYRASSPQKIKKFAGILTGFGIPTTVRRNLGRRIDAACGQLRRRADQQDRRSTVYVQ